MPSNIKPVSKYDSFLSALSIGLQQQRQQKVLFPDLMRELCAHPDYFSNCITERMMPYVSVMHCSTDQFGVRIVTYNSSGKDLEGPESEEGEEIPVIRIFDGGDRYHFILKINPPGLLD